MKLSNALLFLTASTVTATSIRSGSATRNLLSKARKLEENEQEQEGEYQFLSSYSVKLIGCAAGEIYKNPENGEAEYSSVIFRLCPGDDCDDSSSHGCKSGYGDYVVGINSFTEAWLEDKKENMQQDDAFNVEEYSECRQYEVDQDADEENENQQEMFYYVGPTCGEDGASIALGFFEDYTCTTTSSTTFEEISNGWTLPYSSGLVTNSCEGCAGYNDNGEWELSEMCMRLYENSGRCESGMESTGYYGPDESGCEYIQTLMPKSGTNAGAAVGWTIFALVIVGAAAFGYTKWWTKKKSMAADGVMN